MLHLCEEVHNGRPGLTRRNEWKEEKAPNLQVCYKNAELSVQCGSLLSSPLAMYPIFIANFPILPSSFPPSIKNPLFNSYRSSQVTPKPK